MAADTSVFVFVPSLTVTFSLVGTLAPSKFELMKSLSFSGSIKVSSSASSAYLPPKLLSDGLLNDVDDKATIVADDLASYVRISLLSSSFS